MNSRSALIADSLVLCASAIALFIAGQPGWIMLAAVGGLLATRSWGRLVVAALTVAIALAILVAAISEGDALGIVGGLLGAIAGAWAVVGGRRWPALGARYERAAPGELSDWDALDAGIDPTAPGDGSGERGPESD